MRRNSISICHAILLAAAALANAQEPQASPNDALRESVGKWVETMREIQQQEDGWDRDREVLNGYRDGLESEIAGLTEEIAAAEERKQGADEDSLEQVEQQKLFTAAKEQLAGLVRELEKQALDQSAMLPRSLLTEPKMAQVIEEIRADVGMTGDQSDKQLPKRLNNILNFLGEAEKFQQTVHLRDELHTRPDGREFNMKMIYFGLGVAFGVNEGGDFAIIGRPGEGGWIYQERNELAGEVRRLVGITTGDVEAGFVSLPIELR